MTNFVLNFSKQIALQATERILLSNDWMTLLFLLLLVILFFVKKIAPLKFENVFARPFKVHILDKEIYENISFFNIFNIIFLVFSAIVLSILLFQTPLFLGKFISIEVAFDNNFDTFFVVFLKVLIFYFLKFIVEYFMFQVLQLQDKAFYFMVSKWNYYFTTSVYVFLLLIFEVYADLNNLLIYLFIGGIYLITFIMHFLTNKNLIFSNFFYFILYICTLEIAPLLILFKLIF